MRWLPLSVLALAVLPAAVAAPVPKPAVKDEPFWPTAVGTKWVYEVSNGEFQQEVVKAEPLQGGTKITVKTDGPFPSESVLEVMSSGVVSRSHNQLRIDTQLIRLPVKVDDSWTFAYPMQDGILPEGGIMTVGVSEDVKVPAGEFRAIKVVRTVNSVRGVPMAKPYSDTTWYAKGVGVVKVEWDDGQRVLKSFTPGKK